MICKNHIEKLYKNGKLMYSHLNEDLLLEMAEIGRIYGYKINIYIWE